MDTLIPGKTCEILLQWTGCAWIHVFGKQGGAESRGQSCVLENLINWRLQTTVSSPYSLHVLNRDVNMIQAKLQFLSHATLRTSSITKRRAHNNNMSKQGFCILLRPL